MHPVVTEALKKDKRKVWFPGGSVIESAYSPMQETQEMCVPSLGWEDSPEGGKWQPTSVFLPGKFMDRRGAWWAIVHQVTET